MQTDYLNDEEKLKLKQEKKVLEYCEVETIEETKKILSKLKFDYKINGVQKSKWNEKYNSLEIEVTLKRENREIGFIYYASHNDAETYKELKNISDFSKRNKTKKDWTNFKESILYSVLCSCRMDLLTDTTSFSNFCVELGYNQDSIKDRELFLFCGEHKQKLLKIFTEKEAEFLPN